jgi:hypothetical protein
MKLTDKITWNADSSDLLDLILKRVRDQVAEDVKMTCYRNNEVEVTVTSVLNVLNGSMKPLSSFIEPADYDYGG